MPESQDTPREQSYGGQRTLENAGIRWMFMDFLVCDQVGSTQLQVGWICRKSGHKLLENG